jgi:hypothetical protein
MPDYLLLLYATEPSPEEAADRWGELPEWNELTDSLREAGLWVGNDPLESPAAAKTVRARGGEIEITDGPFAVTKEVLAGYYKLTCRDLDEALKVAARLPLARYGSVEVRPIMDLSELPAPDEAAAAGT